MVTRKAEGKEGKAFIGSMTEEKSVELASKIASESFLFAVSHACMGASELGWCCSACMGCGRLQWHCGQQNECVQEACCSCQYQPTLSSSPASACLTVCVLTRPCMHAGRIPDYFLGV
jgi:hypothetical protein